MKSNRKRLLRQAGSVMAALLFCVMLLQQTVFAADPEQTGSIRLNYSADDECVRNGIRIIALLYREYS